MHPARRTQHSAPPDGLDALGSVRVIFDAQGNVVDRMDYGPFGENLRAAITFPVEQFAQLARDAETGQDYAQARQYAAGLGRFTRVDPVYAGLFDPQQWNRYAYAANNPLRYVDPHGLCIDPMITDRSSGICADLTNLGLRGVGGGGGGDLMLMVDDEKSPGVEDSGGVGGNERPPTPAPPPTSLQSTRPSPLAANAESSTGCPTAPRGVSVRSNINKGWAFGLVLDTGPVAALNQVVKYAAMYFAFRNGGPMDYKQSHERAQDFGNFNYGAVNAALNVPQTVAARAAGWAQRRAGTSMPTWGHPLGTAPFGDDPVDQSMISLGYEYYRNAGACK